VCVRARARGLTSGTSADTTACRPWPPAAWPRQPRPVMMMSPLKIRLPATWTTPWGSVRMRSRGAFMMASFSKGCDDLHEVSKNALGANYWMLFDNDASLSHSLSSCLGQRPHGGPVFQPIPTFGVS
jgi:hypothetical protein